MSHLIDGKAIAETILTNTSGRLVALKQHGVVPHLAVILVGTNAASLAYIERKKMQAERVGLTFSTIMLAETATTVEIIRAIGEAKALPHISGIIVQLPLPAHVDKNAVINSIPNELDVDCMTDVNIGRLFLQTGLLVPPTPGAVMEIIAAENIDLSGKHVVLVGTGQLVGKPLSLVLLNTKATVTTCNETTLNLPDVCRSADVLVACAGVPGLIRKDMVKPGATVIDTGAAIVSGKIAGDVRVEEVFSIAEAVTPTPGGVGPITVAKLIENTVLCAESLYAPKND